MINKIFTAIGLGSVLNVTSLLSSEENPALGLVGKQFSEKGFPFAYLERTETNIADKAPETEFIFSNATYNLIFWIAVASIIVYLLFWVLGKFSKLIFILSILTVVGLLLTAFLLS